MTLLPAATHIDIATAMTLWILGIGTSCGVCHPSMTTKVMALWTIMQHLPLTFFYASTLNVILQRLMPLYRLRQSGESTTLLPTATHIDIAAAMALKPTQFFRFSTPVILGLVPRILPQQTPNLFNELALLLHKEYAYTRLSGQTVRHAR